MSKVIEILKKRVFFTLIFFLFAALATGGISFGSLQKVNEIEAYIETPAKAEVLVWNSGEDEFKIIFSITSLPKGWEVNILPNDFSLSKNPSGNVEIINIGEKQLRARVVEIFFKPLAYAKDGEAIITATAKGGEGQVSVFQNRDFKFKLKVKGNLTIEEIKERNLTFPQTFMNEIKKKESEENKTFSEPSIKNVTEKKEKKKGMGGMFVLNENKNFLIALIIISCSLIILCLYHLGRKKRRIRRAGF